MCNRFTKYLLPFLMTFTVGCGPTNEEIKPTRYQEVEVMATTSNAITLKFSKMGEGLALEKAQIFCSEKNKVAIKSEHHKKFGVDNIYTWDCR